MLMARLWSMNESVNLKEKFRILYSIADYTQHFW